MKSKRKGSFFKFADSIMSKEAIKESEEKLEVIIIEPTMDTIEVKLNTLQFLSIILLLLSIACK